jgi:sterol desaturase/sphingolipid hydroxylase (fatty acid hydroxylase superfamily)
VACGANRDYRRVSSVVIYLADRAHVVDSLSSLKRAPPDGTERRLNYFIVTPRMHGIHHSIIHAEKDSNWSSGLTLWDFLHRTLKLNVPQSEITIGVPAYRDENEVRLTEVLGMPFRKQRPTWQLPQNGEPSRAPIAGSPPEKLLA